MIKFLSLKNVVGFTLAVVYFGFRVMNVFLVTPFFDEYDSPAYFRWKLYPSFRTHGITLLYSLINDEFIICLIQAVIGALVWIYLWFIFQNLIKNTSVLIIFTFLFYLLGSSSIIIEQDSSLLSESLSLSSTLFLIGVSIKIFINLKSPTNLEFILFGFAMIWFASTKSSNSIIAPLLVIIYLLSLKTMKNRKLKFALAFVFSILSLFFFINAMSSDITKTLTTSGTINNRLIFSEKWKDRLLNSGYPVEAIKIFNDYSKENLGIPPDQAVVNLPQFKKWWDSGGDSFLLRFTLTNPDYAVIAPVALPLFSEKLNYRKSLLSGWSQGTDRTEEFNGFSNSRAHRTWFWPDEPEKAYLSLAISFLIVGISLSLFTFLNKSREFNSFLIIILLTVIWSYVNWWFGSKPSDMARHNLSAALVFKVIPIFMITLSIDYLIKFKDVIFLRNAGVRTSLD